MKKRKLIITIFAVLMITRVLFLAAVYLSGIPPYLCYDEEYLYAPASLANLDYWHWIQNRQIFYIFCAWLNEYFYLNEFFNLARVSNIIFFGLSCVEIYRMLSYFGWKEGTRNKITVGFGLLPYYIFCSSFRIKDILCMYLTLKLFNYYFAYQEKEKVHLPGLALSAVILWEIRWGICESVFLICGVFTLLKNKKRFLFYVIPAVAGGAGICFLILSHPLLRTLLEQKLSYFTFRIEGEGMLSRLTVRDIRDIYKLIVLLPFTLVMPISNFDVLDMQGYYWSNVMGFFSFAQFFLMPAFYYYLFFIKKGKKEKLIATFFCVWHTILSIASPHTFRHMIFITPFFYLFAFKAFEGRRRNFLLVMGMLSVFIYFAYYFL